MSALHEVTTLPITSRSRFGHRLVVVSPHSDDGVLSLGATLSAHTRAGGEALVVTVLAGDPSSRGPASAWDASGGFASAAAAARGRGREDRSACRTVGARTLQLAGSDEQYGLPWDEDRLWKDLAPVLADADEVLLPGYPMAHADHAAVTRFVLQRLDPDRSVRLYAEEPYTWALRRGSVPRDPWRGRARWSGERATARDAAVKVVAVLRYWTQVKLLTGARGVLDPRWMRLPLRAWRAARRRGEWISEPVTVSAIAPLV